MKTRMRHIEQAKAEDFIIDMSAAGRPVGYKGPRHQPTEWCDCYTDLETILMESISVRDQFAAAALQGWIANGPIFRGEKINGTIEHAEITADVAYVYADAMMRARKVVK